MTDAHQPAATAGARILDPVEFYHSGPTAYFALQSDQRFSYCMYVPSAHLTATTPLPLMVVVHGTNRTAERYRDEFRAFAEEHDCVVLCPLFPGGILEPGDLNGFKRLKFHELRYDHVLLDIIAEVGERYRVRTDRFWLQGFSGGGQFAHRFAYLHAERLAAVSIGAPGRITRIDPDVPWWLGTADLGEVFGRELDLPELRRVAVQMVVGGEDTDTWEIQEPGIDAGGDTRIERITTLRDNWTANGIDVRLDVVPGVKHSGRGILPAAQHFLSATLRAPHNL
jgi:pimeloyl-ACP methyl ester carboxylesterase